MAFRNIPPNGFPAIPDIEDLEAVVKDVSTLKTATAGLAEDVSDLKGQKANQITIALSFDPETTYEVGDLVYYNGLTYRCTNVHTGEWDADDFAGTTIANELDSLKSGLTNIKFGRGRATVQNGYFTLTNTGTSLTSGVVISLMRNDAEGDTYSGLSVYTAITTANEILVYIRKSDGTSPENGTTVSYCYFAFN